VIPYDDKDFDFSEEKLRQNFVATPNTAQIIT
jgi:hypothetical protein